MNYKKSRFLHVYKKEDRICFYHALTMHTLYIDLHDYEPFCDETGMLVLEKVHDNPFFNRLKEYRMIIPENFDEELMLNKIKSVIFKGVSIRLMVMHLTDFCNLRCKYCFIEGGQPFDYCRKTMTVDTAKAAVDKFVQILRNNGNLNNKPTIVFYGGEPLSNFETLKEVLAYLSQIEEEIAIQFDKVIITNGTLIDEEMIPILKKYNILISVSMDGRKEVHDENRLDLSGNGSFDKVLAGIKLLKSNGLEPSISCVMAQNAINECIDTIRFIVEELGVKGVGFNHVSIIPGLNFYDAEYEEKFADSILKVQEYIQKHYEGVYERRMGHKVNMYIDKMLVRADCTGCGEQISVSPDGMIGVCQGYMGSRKTFNNSVFDQNYLPENDPVFQEWSMRSPLNIQKCLECSALATCGGGCPRNADMINGSIWDVDSAFCHFAKKAQEWLVWQDIE